MRDGYEDICTGINHARLRNQIQIGNGTDADRATITITSDIVKISTLQQHCTSEKAKQLMAFTVHSDRHISQNYLMNA